MREAVRCETCRAVGRWRPSGTDGLPAELAALVAAAPMHHRWPWAQVAPGVYERATELVA